MLLSYFGQTKLYVKLPWKLYRNQDTLNINYWNIPPCYCTDFIIINVKLNSFLSSIYLFYLFLAVRATISVYTLDCTS